MFQSAAAFLRLSRIIGMARATNGFDGAGPLMVVMMLIVRNPRAMGRLTVSRGQMIFGWAATLVMIAASALFLAFAAAGKV